MLFSSQPFLLLFLPLALAAFYASARSPGRRIGVLAASSFVFYAWWDPRFVPLLAGTIAFTHGTVALHRISGRRSLLVLGVAGNLAVLGLFKYANFAAEAVLGVAGIAHEPWGLILPLGISFFTFQQVSYLVDRYRGNAPTYGLLEYTAYVSFFPQLIAGPIVRHNELIGQFAAPPLRPGIDEQFARGLVLFTLGLVKKVLFADELAPIADAGFDLAATGKPLATADAWLAATAYTLQLYFDFSAYSDMAMGLAAMFGLRLPLNFDAPYRALDIRMFWRRWHMTLSRFFRDYLYIPLGGSHGSLARTMGAVMLTMLLCGLWHGAGWTFVVWGALHGVAICVNRAWLAQPWRMPAPLAWLLTMLFVIAGWVLFRAADFDAALAVLEAMYLPGADVGGMPDDDELLFVAVAGVCAVAGATSVTLADSPRLLRRRHAWMTAVALFLVTLRVGQGRGLEFIYFQF